MILRQLDKYLENNKNSIYIKVNEVWIVYNIIFDCIDYVKKCSFYINNKYIYKTRKNTRNNSLDFRVLTFDSRQNHWIYAWIDLSAHV